MLIDWFTVGAQTVNFLALLYLLKRFLYGPILRAMDSREQGIAERLRDAEKTQSEAERLAEEYRRRNRGLEEQSVQRLKQAEENAERRRKELIDRAKAEAGELRQTWAEAVSREQALFIGELKKRAGSEILRISRKSVNDLTGEALELRLADVLLAKIQGLDGAEKKKCASAAKNSDLVVRAPFDLGPLLEQKITTTLHAICGSEPPVTYESDPEMALGINVTIGELRLSWGVDNYFDSLERTVSDLLEQSAEPFIHVGKGAS
ncbi:MAG: hypothetical protein KAT20_02815 [Desulfuromonadales bacterium]|nr:hypothetical protein [Desulfuromonadales bacterium]